MPNSRSMEASSLPGFVEAVSKPVVSTRHGRIWSMPRALRRAPLIKQLNVVARENPRLNPLYAYPSAVAPVCEFPPFLMAENSIFSAPSLLNAADELVQIDSSQQSVTLPDHTFEPVVNYPALAAFLLIATVFSLLQMRVVAISNAASHRIDALKQLRETKSAQLSSGLGDKTVSESEVAFAVARYEEALEREEDLRTIIPGVRIAAPNSPGRNKEDLNAAKQFLGKDLLDTDDNPPSDTALENVNETTGSANRGDGDSSTGLSRGAVAVLGLVALSQIALLFILSFDPMATSHVFPQLEALLLRIYR